MHERELRHPVVVAVALLLTACAPKMTPQQAAVEEAFATCRPQGPSTKLEHVDRDGRFSLVGRADDPERVRECMMRQGEPAPPPRVAPRQPSAPARTVAPAQPAPQPHATAPSGKSAPLLASRLPGIWRGTLTLPPRAAGRAETAAPATVKFVVAGGALRWTLATASAGSTLAADGTAVVVDGELRMTGSVRSPVPSAAGRKAVSVSYAGTLVGDRLEVRGVTADKQIHVLSIRRIAD